MAYEIEIECPFCKKAKIHLVHQPFVTRKSMSKSRFGSGGPKYTKESFEVLSGCESCGKTKKEVQAALEGKKEITHEERLERLKKRGLPLVLKSKKQDSKMAAKVDF